MTHSRRLSPTSSDAPYRPDRFRRLDAGHGALHDTIAKGTPADGLFSDCKKAHRDLQRPGG